MVKVFFPTNLKQILVLLAMGVSLRLRVTGDEAGSYFLLLHQGGNRTGDQVRQGFPRPFESVQMQPGLRGERHDEGLFAGLVLALPVAEHAGFAAQRTSCPGWNG
jgi:hypothetical protein